MLRRIPSAVQHRRHEAHRRRHSRRRLFVASGVRRRSHSLPADIHTRRRPLRSLRFSTGAQSHRHRIRRSDSGVFDFLACSNRAGRPRLQEPGCLRGGFGPGAALRRRLAAGISRGPAPQLPCPRQDQKGVRRETPMGAPARIDRGGRGRRHRRLLSHRVDRERGMGHDLQPHARRFRLQSRRRSRFPAPDIRRHRIRQEDGPRVRGIFR